MTVGYKMAHDRVRGARGRAADHLCACGVRAAEWSYDGGCSEELVQPEGMSDAGSVYCLHVECYTPRCRRCHAVYDNRADISLGVHSSGGTSNPRSKLSDSDVTFIRTSYGVTHSLVELAEMFGVSERAIWNAARGLSYKANATPPVTWALPVGERPKKMTPENRAEAIRLWETGDWTQVRIAEHYGVTTHYIWAIINERK